MFNLDILDVRIFFINFVWLILQQNANNKIKRKRQTTI